MLIAQEKRKNNIAEYLLYMWQVEDMIRALDLDIDKIDEHIISRYPVSDEEKREIREWYESLIKMMELENVKSSGHLQINKNVIIRLTDLHVQLLASDKFDDYKSLFYRVLPHIVEFRSHMPQQQLPGEIESCFNALYGVLIRRLGGKEVSAGTEQAISEISQFIGTLAAYYKKDEESPLFGNDDEDINQLN